MQEPAKEGSARTRDESRNPSLVVAIVAASFVFYVFIILIRQAPLGGDEGYLSLSISEFCDNPAQVMPTLGGAHVELKPPLFTWVYAAFHMLLNGLPLQPESAFRLPSAFFCSLDAGLVFLIAGRLYGKRAGFISAVLFLFAPIAIFSGTTALMESFAIFLSLCAVLSYLDSRFGQAALFLGALVLCKWMYAAAPVLFALSYFWGERRLGKALLSFIAIPIALACYLLLAMSFGSLDNALANLALDTSRPMPSFDLVRTLIYWTIFLSSTFPLGVLFPMLALSARDRLWDERCIAVPAAAAFLLPFSGVFLFWYAAPLIPFLCIYAAKRVDETGADAIAYVLVAGLALTGVLIFLGISLHSGAQEIAEFSKNREVSFLEPLALQQNWKPVNDAYYGTSRSFLLLEQNNPGFLYYRFGSQKDYENIHAYFAAYGDAPPCKGYLIVHEPLGENYSATVPGCFGLQWKQGEYAVYLAG